MTVHTSSQGTVISALNTQGPGTADIVDDSPYDHLHRGFGEIDEKDITLSANNTTASVNLFQITNSVQIYRIWGEVTRATTLANLTAGSFDLYDSTAAVQISAATGVLSGASVGTIFAKTGLAANAFDVNDATAGSVIEQTYEGSDVFNSFIVTQKNGADTFVRFTYTTTDAPIDADIMFYVEFRTLDGGTLTAV